MKEALTKAVEKSVKRFYGYRDAVLTFSDPEDLHQMRVSGRTLLSYLYVLADNKESKRAKFRSVRKPLKKAMDMLGELRDADVLLEEVESRMSSFSPSQRNIIARWLESRRTGIDGMREKLVKELPSVVDKKWKKRADGWAEESIPGLASKKLMLKKIEELRQEKALALDSIVGYGQPDMCDEEFLTHLHKGRIAVKKLRYTLSVAKKFMDIDPQDIEAQKMLQDQLGHIQDMRVWISQLCDFYNDESTDAKTIKAVGKIADSWRAEMLETLDETCIIKHL